jgi:hypothetical protein
MMGDPARGLPLALNAVQLTKESIEQNAAFQSERQQLAMQIKVQRFLNVYLQVASMSAASAEEMYTQAMNWKADVGARQQQMRRVQAGLNKSGNSDALRIKRELDDASSCRAPARPIPTGDFASTSSATRSKGCKKNWPRSVQNIASSRRSSTAHPRTFAEHCRAMLH